MKCEVLKTFATTEGDMINKKRSQQGKTIVDLEDKEAKKAIDAGFAKAVK